MFTKFYVPYFLVLELLDFETFVCIDVFNIIICKVSLTSQILMKKKSVEIRSLNFTRVIIEAII